MSRSEATFHESSHPEDHTLPTPDGGYGWVIVGSCFILNALTWGVASPFGVHLTDYVSSKSIGYVTAPFASKTWHLYLTQGALVGSGIGFIVVPSTAVLSQWFSKRRSMANGISSAGSGVGGAAFTWGTAAMIQRQGLSWALRTTGIITFVGIVIATLLLRDINSQIQPNQRAFDITLLRSKAVVLLLLWAFISMFGSILDDDWSLISRSGGYQKSPISALSRLAATIIPTAFEVIGYIGRTIPETLGAYIVQSIFLLVAPALFAVSIYMELGRIVDLVDGDHYLYVRRRWLTRIFVIGDVLSFFMQGAGGGMMGSDDTDFRKLGEKLIVFGLFVRIVFFGCFVITAAMFHLRLCRSPTQKVIADKPSC
ncbi:major facilitator superfamily transporter [Fusarium proliferatum]|nr:major facilitator superfamily transporter [Fusarium proliferatum]